MYHKKGNMLAYEKKANLHLRRPVGPVHEAHGKIKQGHSTATILSNRSRDLTVISDTTYGDKLRTRPVSPKYPPKGTRSMHMTTMTFETNPLPPNFKSTARTSYSGMKDGFPVERAQAPIYPYLHMSQFDIGNAKRGYWDTSYDRTYFSKPVNPPSNVHWPTLENKMTMNAGQQMHNVLTRENHKQNFFSQYKRIHDKLGAMVGPEEPRGPRTPPVRKQYNILTGEYVGPAWTDQNRNISGNRVLYGTRRCNTEFQLG